jgi:cadherin-like protein/putative Ig domain-containing protein
VRVRDAGGLAATQSLTITVPQPNRPPLITSTPVTTATVGLLYSYAVAATDPDTGEVLTFALTTAPSGMAITAVTELIQWTPTATQVGNHDVTVLVQDRGGVSATQSFTVAVSQPNHPPQITSTPVTVATAGQAYRYAVTATDPDVGDSLTFALPIAPTDMTIDAATGLIQWTPTVAQVGELTVMVQVQDSVGTFVTQSFTVAVTQLHRPPVTMDDSYTSAEHTTFTVPPPGVLGNDTDPDNDLLTATLVQGQANGALALNPDGFFTYIPDSTMSGLAHLTYPIVMTVPVGNAPEDVAINTQTKQSLKARREAAGACPRT